MITIVPWDCRLTHVDAVLSDTKSPADSFADTDYVEASLGLAYRPVDNERLNALFKYTWLYDLPGNDQVISGATGDYLALAQRSHILSVDVISDLAPWLSIGGKYGFHYGEVKCRVGGGSGFDEEWQRSSATSASCADLRLIKNWDLLLEAGSHESGPQI